MEMAREKRPRALILLAHYLPFTKLLPHVWWMDGIADKEIYDIYNYVGREWHNQLIVPLAARKVSDKVLVARLLLEDPNWETAGDDKYHDKRDERTKDLAFIDNKGRKTEFKAAWVMETEPTDTGGA
jgi:hypothetical protein